MQNQNQVKLPKFSGKGSLQSFINQLDNAALIGNWTKTSKARQYYAQLTDGALAYVDGRPPEDWTTFERLMDALREKYECKVKRRSKEPVLSL